MNKHQLQQIKHKLQLIINSNYNQSDIKGLIIGLRSLCNTKKSILREIGDFLAHPDLRDKGMAHGVIKSVYDKFSNSFLGFWDGPIQTLKFNVEINHAYTEDVLLYELLETLKTIGLCNDAVRLALKNEIGNVSACILCELQDVPIKTDKETARLFLGVSKKGTLGIFVNAPVIKEARLRGAIWEIVDSSYNAIAEIEEPEMPSKFLAFKQMTRIDGHLELKDLA